MVTGGTHNSQPLLQFNQNDQLFSYQPSNSGPSVKLPLLRTEDLNQTDLCYLGQWLAGFLKWHSSATVV